MVKSILLVEDDPFDEILILRSLRQHTSLKIIVARDGLTALDILFDTSSGEPADRFCLILLDLKLPKVSCVEVLCCIREDGGAKSIPIILCSGSEIGHDLCDSFNLTANNHLRKHVDSMAFCGEMDRVMSYWRDTSSPKSSGAPASPQPQLI